MPLYVTCNASSELRKPLVDMHSVGGFYSWNNREGLEIVSLNTVLWYSRNNATSGISDPCGQLAWLEDLLQKASNQRRQVS